MTPLIVRATAAFLLVAGMCAISWWVCRDQKKKAEAVPYVTTDMRPLSAVQEAKARAIIAAIRAGKNPLAVQVHMHPSGHPIVEVICEGDAVARAEEILAGVA